MYKPRAYKWQFTAYNNMYILHGFQCIPFCGIDEEHLFNSQDHYSVLVDLFFSFFLQLLCLIDQCCCKEKFNFGHSE